MHVLWVMAAVVWDRWHGCHRRSDDGFPYGTFAVNIAGCVLLGWLLTADSKRGKICTKWRLMLGTSLLSSFTTFSTFSMETVQLWRSGSAGTALLYVNLSVVLGCLLAYAGWRLAAAIEADGDPE